MATHSGILAWRIPWTEKPGESHGQRSLEGYSPRGHKELDTAKATWHIGDTHGSLTAVFLRHEWDKNHSGSSKFFCRF